MLVDWFTTAAQIVNFLVLVFLLKKFLYGPIIRAMDAREEKIASRLEEARQKQAEAEFEVETYREKGRQLDKERELLIDRARKDAESVRKELTEQARQEVEELRNNWVRALQRNRTAFLDDLRKRTTEQVYRVARKALGDLATKRLEECMTDVFLDLLKEVQEEQREQFREALKRAGNRVTVSSAFDLLPDRRQVITREIHSIFEEGVDVQFQTEPDLVTGIELKTPTRVVAWNLDEYLKSLERKLSEVLAEETEKAAE